MPTTLLRAPLSIFGPSDDPAIGNRFAKKWAKNTVLFTFAHSSLVSTLCNILVVKLPVSASYPLPPSHMSLSVQKWIFK